MLRLTVLKIGFLAAISSASMPKVIAANVTPIHKSIEGLRAQVIFKSGEQPAQTQKRPELHQNFGWQNSGQLRSMEREEKRYAEEQRQFNYFYPNRQIQENNSNSNLNKKK